jgi:hypothetical protein
LKHFDKGILFIFARLDLAHIHAECSVVAVGSLLSIGNGGDVFGEILDPFGRFGRRVGMMDERRMRYLQLQKGILDGVIIDWWGGLGFILLLATTRGGS